MKEHLPGFVLAELFGNSLVSVDELKAPLAKDDLVKNKKLYLGDYKKKIVIITSDNNNMYVSDESLEFLSGVLNACKLNLADIALTNFNNTAVNFLDLKKEMQLLGGTLEMDKVRDKHSNIIKDLGKRIKKYINSIGCVYVFCHCMSSLSRANKTARANSGRDNQEFRP